MPTLFCFFQVLIAHTRGCGYIDAFSNALNKNSTNEEWYMKRSGMKRSQKIDQKMTFVGEIMLSAVILTGRSKIP